MAQLVYIIVSDEVLLQQEACDKIIASIAQNNELDRQIVDVGKSFNWDEMIYASQSLSLFAQAQLFDIRFSSVPDTQAKKVLVELTSHANEDNRYLIRLPLLLKKQLSAKWFKSLSQVASVEVIYPPNSNQYQYWIMQRAKNESVQLEADAALLLAEQTEGNLLAASQAINKLAILYPSQAIGLDRLTAVISDSSRYSVFQCCDQALLGNGEKAVRILNSVKQESLHPILVLSALSRSVRICSQVSQAKQKNQSADSILNQNRVWGDTKLAINKATQSLPLVLFQKILIRFAFLDRMIKGQEKGDIWREMESCLWLLSGKRIWNAK
ncbi:MAG: DNA polymerase III subunit delta [Enterobacterales bacterium]|nr:DNA polymerase III subunit delta [Enterobacterales bacterium]